MLRPSVAWILALLLAAAPALADFVPRDGLDAVALADGRVLRCRAGVPKAGAVELAFSRLSLVVPEKEILEIRRAADFDPAPRSDEEKALVSQGKVRWAGRWIDPKARDAAVAADADRLRRLRGERGASLTWEKRLKRNTAHFSIEANLAKKDLDHYERLLEGFYDYFTSGFKVSAKRRIPVYLFRTREEFMEFARKDTGKSRENIAGYFMPSPGNEHLVLFDWQGDRGETVGVLFHEAVHLFIHLANPQVRVPPMFNEGLAEYYGASVLRDGKWVRGRIQEGRLLNLRDMLAAGEVPGLDDLLATGHPDPDSPGKKEFDAPAYAHAWAFVHFLFHGQGGKYLPRLQAYLNGHWSLRLKDADDGSTAEYRWMRYQDDRDLLLRCLKVKDFATLDAEFRAYVDTLEVEGAVGLATRGLRGGKGAPPSEDAEAALDAALAKVGDDPETLARLVKVLALAPGRGPEALRLMERAFALDPLNMNLRYELSGHFADSMIDLPHLLLCAEFDPLDGVGRDALAWLHFKGVDPATGGSATGFGGEADLEKERDRLRALPAPTPVDRLRLANAELRLGEPAAALPHARAAAEALPGEPEPAAALARATAALGDKGAFNGGLQRFRAAALARAGQFGEDLEVADRLVRWVVVEGVGYAIRREKFQEARTVLDAWTSLTGGEPRSEGEWIYHAGLPIRLGDIRAGAERLRKGYEAIPGAQRLGLLVDMIPDDLLPDEEGK